MEKNLINEINSMRAIMGLENIQENEFLIEKSLKNLFSTGTKSFSKDIIRGIENSLKLSGKLTDEELITLTNYLKNPKQYKTNFDKLIKEKGSSLKQEINNLAKNESDDILKSEYESLVNDIDGIIVKSAPERVEISQLSSKVKSIFEDLLKDAEQVKMNFTPEQKNALERAANIYEPPKWLQILGKEPSVVFSPQTKLQIESIIKDIKEKSISYTNTLNDIIIKLDEKIQKTKAEINKSKDVKVQEKLEKTNRQNIIFKNFVKSVIEKIKPILTSIFEVLEILITKGGSLSRIVLSQLIETIKFLFSKLARVLLTVVVLVAAYVAADAYFFDFKITKSLINFQKLFGSEKSVNQAQSEIERNFGIPPTQGTQPTQTKQQTPPQQSGTVKGITKRGGI